MSIRLFNLMILLLIGVNIKAQHQIRVDHLVDETIIYEAQNSVKFIPGSSCEPSAGETIIGRINKNLPTTLSDISFSWASIPNSDRPFNKNLPFAGLKGTAAVDAFGQAGYSIPITAPPGIQNLKPSLSINYGSGLGKGQLGHGWTIGGISQISRIGKSFRVDGTNTSVDFSSDDRFALNGNRLTLTSSGTYGADGQTYDTEVKQNLRVTSFGNVNSAPEKFIVETKDGLRMEFGYTNDSRQYLPGTSKILSWHLNRIEDRNGNYIDYKYEYVSSTGETLIKQISYTGNENANQSPTNHILFGYGDFSDLNHNQNSIFLASKKLSTTHLLNRIEVYESSNLISDYKFTFANANPEIRLIGIDYVDGDGNATNSLQVHYQDQELTASDLAINSTSFDEGGSSSFITADFNGDGRTDLLRIPKHNQHEQKWRCFVSNENGSFTDWDNGSLTDGTDVFALDINNDGYSDFVACKNSTAQVFVGSATGMILAQAFTSTWPISTPGFVTDLDGNGLPELFLNLNRNGHFDNFGRIQFTPSKGFEMNVMGFGHNPLVGENLITLDFNGNGKTNLLQTSDGTTTIYELIDGSFTSIYTDSYPSKDHKIFVGDFNGDGKSDVITLKDSDWKIGYSNGNSFDVEDNPSYFNQLNSFSIGTGTNDNLIFIADIDGNGKSDVLQWYNNWENGTASNSTFNVILHNGTTAKRTHVSATISETNVSKDIFLTDLNGDGNPELFFKRLFNKPGEKISFFNDNQELLASRILDGFNNAVEFDYQPLSKSSVYSRTGQIHELFFSTIRAPFKVVHEMISPNSDGTRNKTTYTYSDGLFHSQGKGMMGFLKIEEKFCSTLTNCDGFKTVKEFDYSGSNAFPHQWLKNTKVYNTQNSLISESIVDLKMDYNPVLGNLSYFPYHESETSIDHINNITLVTDYTYDFSSGNVLSKTTTVNSGYKEKHTYTYKNVNSWTENKLTQEDIVLSHPDEPETFSKSTVYDYYPNGNLKFETDFYGEAKSITQTLEHDGYGNVLKLTISSPNETDRVSTNTISSDGRFVLSSSNPMGFKMEYEYDSRWGKVKSTSYEGVFMESSSYDAYGDASAFSLGNLSGTKTRKFYQSGNAPTETFYSEEIEYDNGLPGEKYYFNKLGKLLRKTSKGFHDLVYEDFQYDRFGRLIKRSLPYYQTDSPKWNSYSYDANNRIQSVVNSNGTSLSYQYWANKTRVTNVQTGQYVEKTLDELGRAKTINNNSHVTSLTYHINGQTKTMSGANNHDISYQYDRYGMQINMSDDDVGSISYAYNAFGELTSQTEGSNVISLTYDKLGRPISKTTVEDTYTFDYDQGNGLAKGSLSKVSTSSGDYIEYTYDNLGNLISEENVIDGQPYTFSYTYDQLDRLNTRVYPSGFSTQNVYSNDGFLVEIRDKQLNKSIWKTTKVSALDQLETQEFGNGLTTQREYDSQDLLTRIATGSFQDETYSFNPHNGNLQQRTDRIKGLSESYTYNSLDQLESINQNSGQSIFSIDYKNGGQIAERNEVGKYYYGQKGSQLNYIVPELDGQGAINSSIPTLTQELSYTSFRKVSSIKEGDLTASFKYGPWEERSSMEVSNQGELTRKITYVHSGYEIEERDGEIFHYHYIPGEDGTAAINIMDREGRHEMYYVHKDFLGSWNYLSDKNGALVEESSFDAWGRRRNPDDWSFNEIPSSRISPRGYTGHEHLDDPFHIINMNGRIYDPLVGMMMSTDNYIPGIGNPNAHNRYAYALNNPLKYTDPSGDHPVLVAIGMISMGMNLTQFGNATLQILQGNNSPHLVKQFQSSAFGIAGFGGVTSNVANSLVSSTASIFAKTLANVAVSGVFSGTLAHMGGESFLEGFTSGGVAGLISYAVEDLPKDIQFIRSTRKSVMLQEVDLIWDGTPGSGYIDGGADAINSRVLQATDPIKAAIYNGHTAFIIGALENPGVQMLMMVVPAAEVAGLAANALRLGVGQALKTGAKETVETVAMKALPSGGKTVKHHIFNVFRGKSPKSQVYRDFFKKHGIDLDAHTVHIPENLHKQVHQAGKNWTTKWKNWIDANPNATTKEVYQQAGKMMDDFGLSGYKIKPYK